ncbi:MAG: carbohydrate-binding domain-containing protein [Prevotella sp.]|nr:carbohydrate-binding domain-containing protein [Candidatus Prevotella equi]
MKKLLISILSIVLAVFASAASILKGDVNGDGAVTMADANAVIQKSLGIDVQGFIAEAADVNGDGSIDKEDAASIVRIFLDLDKASELEEMTGQAMLLKLTTGETIAIETATITDRSISDAGDIFTVTTAESQYAFNTSDIVERTYGDMPTKYLVTYDGTAATVVNPYYAKGVTTSISNADVVINNANTAEEMTFELSGTTTDGSLKYNASYKSTFVLNNVSITNTRGGAIDIQCSKRVAMELKKGTTNNLVDGEGGSQKAALYCKGHLEIDKTGTLNVTGNTKHAISAKEYIQLKKSEGTINILASASDGIHCGQYFLSNGYNVNINNVAGDGIQAEASAATDYAEDYPDGSINICGGTYSITVTGDNTAALKADGDVTINSTKMNTNITINATGAGSRGIDADGSVTISDDATVIGIEANGKGGIETISAGEEQETKKSYVVYVALTTGTNGGFGGMQGSNYWTSVYLYKADGTLVSKLTDTVTRTGTNGQSLTFYYYDFKAADSDTYYFKSDNYTSQQGGRPGGSSTSYTIISKTFTGPTSGIDYYYQISSSYTTSGTTRTFTISSVQETYGGGTSDTETGETYYASCIKADKDVTINGGTLTLSNSGLMSKSIKAGNSENAGTVTLNGGDVTANISGTMYLNGTDASYCSAIKTDKYVGNGGSLTVTATKGNASRAITADESIIITDGTYVINNSTNGQSGTNDNYTAKALTCDKNIIIEGGSLDIKMTGSGGKGIKADGEITIGRNDGTGPDIKLSTTGSTLGGGSSSNQTGGRPGQQSSTGSSAKGIKAIGKVEVLGGSLYVTTATDGAEGLESKTSVKISGGTHYFQCYDDCINSAGTINFAGGTTVCYANGNDAVDSNYGRTGAITISGGNIFAYTTKGSPEEGLDCDNNSYIVVTGGIVVSAGGQQGGGTSSSIGSSSQGYYIGASPSSYSSSNYYTLCNTSGTPICTFRFAANVTNQLGLLTAPNLGKGSVTVKSGTAKPTAYDINVNDVFFINPTVTTSSTVATVTAK